MIDCALLNNEGNQVLTETLDSVWGKLICLAEDSGSVDHIGKDVSGISEGVQLKDPDWAKMKGRSKRVKSKKENAAKCHKRHCTCQRPVMP